MSKDTFIQQIERATSPLVQNPANYKFMNLLRSRLTEEDIPLDVATMIVLQSNYDLSQLDEEDDYIGQVALAYAELCGDVYRRLAASNWHRNMSPEMVKKFFVVVDLVYN